MSVCKFLVILLLFCLPFLNYLLTVRLSVLVCDVFRMSYVFRMSICTRLCIEISVCLYVQFVHVTFACVYSSCLYCMYCMSPSDEFFSESRSHLKQELFTAEDEFSSLLSSSFLQMAPTVVKAW